MVLLIFDLSFFFSLQLDSFQAAPAVHRWWGSGERARRPGHTAWVPRDNQPTDAEAELYANEARLQH